MPTIAEITKYDDLIDSRDIIARIEFLDSDDIDDDEREELASLRELADQGRAIATDWEYGECLIRDSYFVTYAQELAEDCCDVPISNSWPHYCIDWEYAARDLKMDYTPIEFSGITYWIRS